MTKHTIAMWDDAGGRSKAVWMYVEAESPAEAIAQVKIDAGLVPGGVSSQGGSGETIFLAAWEGKHKPWTPKRCPDARAEIAVAKTESN